ALFEGDLLVGVAHALALVGLRRTDVADLRGHLPDLLAIDALDDDLGLARGLDGDAFRDREVHRVREAEREVEGLALHLRAKADAHELELLLVTLGDAPHHVGEVRAGGAGERTRLAGIGVLHLQALLRLDDADTLSEDEAQRALRALQRHGTARDRRGHALRQLDRRFGNSRHGRSPLRHDAEHFAALPDRARLLVRHDALGRGDDDRPHAAQDLGQLVLAAVDAQARAADTLQAIDDRAAFEVLEADGQGRLAGVFLEPEVSDVAFVPQHLHDGGLQPRGGEANLGLARGLAVADARQEIGDRIGHAHGALLTSSPSRAQGSRRGWPPRGSSPARGRTCGRPRVSGP